MFKPMGKKSNCTIIGIQALQPPQWVTKMVAGCSKKMSENLRGTPLSQLVHIGES